VILDVFSRYAVGWSVQHRESAELAKALIAQATAQQQIGRDQLTIHADRGSSMTSKPVAFLLADLGVLKTHNRPICFVALVVIRVAELRTGQTWRTIGDELMTIKLGSFRSPDGEFTQRTELTANQRHLLGLLGVPEPPRFGHITPTARRTT
jgi:hypothetical protein